MKAKKILLITPPMTHAHPMFELSSLYTKLKGRKLFYYMPYNTSVLTAALKNSSYEATQADLNTLIYKHNLKVPLFSKKRIRLNSLNNRRVFENNYIGRKLNSKKLLKLAENIISIIDLKDVDLVGFSVFSKHEYFPAILLAQAIKTINDRIKIVIGGPLIIHAKFHCFKELNFVDYLISGDGETSLVQLVNHLCGKTRIEDVANLIYRNDSGVVNNKMEISPIENQCIPDFSGLDISDYFDNKSHSIGITIPYMLTRGCVNKCSFCSNPFVDKYECKSFEKVIEELKILKIKYSALEIPFIVANIIQSDLKGLCHALTKANLKINWIVAVNAVELDKELITLMRDAGCAAVRIGLESGSNRILSSMNERYTAESAVEMIRYAKKMKIKITVSIISGYPHERAADIRDNITLLKEICSMCKIIIHPFTIAYNSSIYNYPEKHGVEVLSTKDGCGISQYAYNEIGGFSWPIKKAFAEYSYFRLRTYHNFLKSKLLLQRAFQTFDNVFIIMSFKCFIGMMICFFHQSWAWFLFNCQCLILKQKKIEGKSYK